MVNGMVPEVPFFEVMGNHENRKVFKERMGPFNFSLDSARLELKVIVLDNANYVLKVSEMDYLKRQLAAKRKTLLLPCMSRRNTEMELAYLQRRGKSLKMSSLKMGSGWLFISTSISTTGM